MNNLIRVRATWDYDPQKVFPNELHLWSNCPECNNEVDLLKYFCYYIPNIPKNLIGNGMEITVRCPECEFMFKIVSISYNRNM